MARDFNLKTVEGVSCIVWNFPALSENPKIADKEKTARRKRRDNVGADNEDVFMLDISRSTDKKQYCDLIFISQRHSAWEQIITDYYKDMDVEKKVRKTNYSLTIKKPLGKILVTVTIYPSTNKVMVQPGDRCESNLLEWIRASKFYLQKVLNSQSAVSTSCSTEHKAGQPPSHDHVAAENMMVSMPHITVPTSNADTPTVTPSANVPGMVPVAMLETSKSILTSSSSSANGDGGARSKVFTARPIHVNEMLCFIQNRMDTLPADFIVKTCTSFYHPDVIAVGKTQIFDHTKDVRDDPSQRHRRIRAGEHKSQNDVYDIIGLFHTLELKVTPSYVAMDLTNLPPLGAFDNDVISLRSELNEMKSSIQQLTESQQDIKTITQMVKSLCVSNAGVRDALPLRMDTDAPGCSSPPAAEQFAATSMVDASFLTVSEASITPISNHTSTPEPPNNSHNQQAVEISFPHATPEMEHPHSHGSGNTKDRQHSNIVFGCGHSTILKSSLSSVNHERDRRSKPANGAGRTSGANKTVSRQGQSGKAVSGIFITRLDPKTTASHVALHIRKETRLTVRPEKLLTRHASYSSFYIRGNQRCRSELLSRDLWPKGVLVKPFYD